MSEDLGVLLEGQTSKRKLRLFACACARQVWEILPALCHEPLEAAERHADGLAADEELQAAWDAAQAANWAADAAANSAWAARAVYWAAGLAPGAAWAAIKTANWAAGAASLNAGQATWDAARADQLRVFHDLFDRGARPPVTPTVTLLALAMYERGNFGAMPILADALEEAGCADAEVLNHCRTPGVHARGCWVIDNILGRK
jgi:hypothetical protein